jgi:hypothetical protein
VLDWGPHHEDVWGSEGIAPRILNLGIRWRWMVSSTLRPLYHRKNPQYPLVEAGWDPEPAWTRWRREKFPAPCRELNPDHPAHSLGIIKVKLFLCLTKHHAMKTYWGSGGIVPRILDLGTRWRWVVSFTTLLLYLQGKSPWYALDRRLGGPQSRSGRGGEEKNSQPAPGIEP